MFPPALPLRSSGTPCGPIKNPLLQNKQGSTESAAVPPKLSDKHKRVVPKGRKFRGTTQIHPVVAGRTLRVRTSAAPGAASDQYPGAVTGTPGRPEGRTPFQPVGSEAIFAGFPCPFLHPVKGLCASSCRLLFSSRPISYYILCPRVPSAGTQVKGKSPTARIFRRPRCFQDVCVSNVTKQPWAGALVRIPFFR